MSAVPKWQAGHLYLPGDLVQPLQVVAGAAAALVNPSFDAGDSGWTKGAGFSIVTGEAYDGTYAAQYQAAPQTNAFVEQIASIPITPGESVSATCMVNQGASSANDAGGSVWIRWYDASDALLSATQGSVVKSGSDGAWYQSSVTGTAPAGAAAFRIAGECYLLGSGQALWLDRFTLSYVPKSAPEGLIFKAVQPEPGTSANAEPAWPTTLGVQVIDNTVTWEAVYASRVTWQASPALQSGTVEPVWPTEPGAFVSDGTISWECITRRVEDEKCPNSKEVVIIASKVFATDGDIVRFSATANPLDWSGENDAGFIPTGLQSANSNDVKVLAQYRGNLTPFNASSFQNWQVDPDPQNMAILDQMEGIGSTWHKAAQPVANDLFYLSQLGVRSVGIAAGTNNLAAGDIGMPIDVLVRAKLASPPVRDGLKPLATYYPGAGQYWLAFRDCGTPTIAGSLPDGTVGGVVSYQLTVTPAYPGQTITVSATGLPDGLSCDAGGLITGTLTVAGDFTPVYTATADCGAASVSDTAVVTDVVWLVSGASGLGLNAIASSVGTEVWASASAPPASFIARSGNEIVVWGSGGVYYSANAGGAWSGPGTISLGGRPAFAGLKFGGVWVLVSDNANAHRSADGLNYTAIPYGSYSHGPACAASPSLIVVAGTRSAISADGGLTWTEAPSFVFDAGRHNGRSMAYGDGVFICGTTGNTAPYDDNLFRSADGLSWTALPTPFNGTVSVSSVDYDPVQRRWGAVCGADFAYSDDNGDTWTLIAGVVPVGFTVAQHGLKGYAGKWVIAAASASTSSPDEIRSSLDGGVTWAARVHGITYAVNAVNATEVQP